MSSSTYDDVLAAAERLVGGELLALAVLVHDALVLELLLRRRRRRVAVVALAALARLLLQDLVVVAQVVLCAVVIRLCGAHTAMTSIKDVFADDESP